jgi:hypothetical protein
MCPSVVLEEFDPFYSYLAFKIPNSIVPCPVNINILVLKIEIHSVDHN